MYMAALGLVCLQAVAWTQVTMPEKEFEFARKLYTDELYTLASEQLKAFAEKYPNSEMADDALFMSGESFFAEGDYAAAFEAFKLLELTYVQSPHVAKARFRMAQCQKHRENYAAAGALFERVPIFHPQSDLAEAAWLEAGKAFKRAQRPNEARNALLRLIKDFPDASQRIDAHLELVRISMDRNQFEDALAQIDGIFRAFGTEFKDARVYWLRAQILEMTGYVDEAKSLYATLTRDYKAAPQAEDAAFRLAELYRVEGAYKPALEMYDVVLTATSDASRRVRTYLRKGDVLSEAGQHTLALQAYKNAQESMSMDMDAMLKLELAYKTGNAMAAAGRESEAVTHLTEIIENTSLQRSDSSSIIKYYLEGTHLLLIRTLQGLGRASEALQSIRRLEQTHSESARLSELTLMKGKLLEHGRSDFASAVRVYQSFVDAHPRHKNVDEAQFSLARCYEKLQEYKLARIEYEEYLRTYAGGEDHARAAERLAVLSEAINASEEYDLRQFSDFILKLSESGGKVNYELELGKTYFKMKSLNNAISSLKRALSRGFPDTLKPEIYYYLGKSYYYLGARKSILDDSVAQTLYDSSAISLAFLTENFSEHEYSEEAYFLLTKMERMRTDSISGQTLQRLRSWQQEYPGGKYLDYATVTLAEHVLNTSKGDTSAIRKARQSFSTLSKRKTKSTLAERAAFGNAHCATLLDSDSLALSLLDSFISGYPASRYLPKAFMMRAQLYRKAGDAASARRDLRSVRDDYFYTPQAARAALELAELESQQGNHELSLKLYDETLRNWLQPSNNSNNMRAALQKRAELLRRLGRHSDALKAYLAFLDTYPAAPQSEQARFALAQIAHELGHHDAATEYYKLIAASGQNVLLRFESNLAIGNILFDEKLYAEAEKFYKAALDIPDITPPDKRRAEKQLIRCQFKVRQFSAAEADAGLYKKKYADTRDDEAQFLLDAANAHKSAKNFELARKAFKKLRDDYKGSEWGARGEFGLGAVDLITNHTEDALKTLTAIPDKYPDSEVTPLAYFNLGDFYVKSQQMENAIHAFKKVLQHPQAGDLHEKALLYLIQVYRDAGMYDQAIVSTRSYLDTYADSEHAFRKKIDLAQLLMQLKDYRRAIDQLEVLLPYADSETEAEIQFYIAQCYKEMGNFKQASAEYLKVKYLTKPTKLPWHVTALFETGRCLVRMNEIDQARRIFNRIVAEQGAASNFGRFALKQLEELEAKARKTAANGKQN